MKAFNWQTRIRTSEVGPDGTLRAWSALQLLQEMGVLSSESNGYGPRQYFDMAMTFMVFNMDVMFDAPARICDVVNLKSWVSDFKRVRSQRETLVTAQDGTIVMRSQVTWVFMDANTRRPARMKDEFHAAFQPEPGNYAVTEAKPELPPDIVPRESVRMAHYSDVDGLGHVNHTVSLNYVLDDLAEQEGGLGTVKRIVVTYAGQLKQGESAMVLTLGERREGNRVTTRNEVRAPAEQVLTATVVREL